MSNRPRIDVDGLVFEWDRENGQMLVWGEPITCMWTKTTMAGLMSGLRKTAGSERYLLAIEQAGRASIDSEWAHIAGHPTFEEEFR